MWNMIQGEWRKMRHCQILLVGIIAVTLCPIIQYGSQLIIEPEYRDAAFNFVKLFSNVIWGNTQIFLPISFVMIGGWLIDRESVNDTLKNILTVPVSMPKLLFSKLWVTGCLSLLFGIYSVGVTLLTGIIVGLPGLSAIVLIANGAQVIFAAFTTFLVCTPMILIFGQIRGAYLGGSIFAFFLGYCMLFFKSGFLLSAYPFSAALILAGFDMTEYNGAVSVPSKVLAFAGIVCVLIITVLILVCSGRQREIKSMKQKKRKNFAKRHTTTH